METSLFNYSFPKELVAQHPLPRREGSRMLVLKRQEEGVSHRHFPDIIGYLRETDLLVLNDALADLVPVEGKLVPPLPPYIKRKRVEDFTEEDMQRYRTVYARTPGSKAAPTAGFHFSEPILQKIREKGVGVVSLTLHISYDTYKPIRSEKTRHHPMHGEEYVIPEETAEAVLRAKKEGRRVIAVGTTVVRALESWGTNVSTSVRPYVDTSVSQYVHTSIRPRRDDLKTYRRTDLFITPGYPFKIVDALLTNFHRPRSTVLVLVSAFAGRERVLAAYEEAIQEKYRLFSYGDCMLIL